MEGQTHASRSIEAPGYLPNGGDPGPNGGGLYNGTGTENILGQWENIFGPAGRDIRQDQQRGKRIQRLHIPDTLKGHNVYMNDRIDGLIADATDSPFTTLILPYKWLETPDAKIVWNVFSYDSGMASRVPYESAARVLTQTKRSYGAFAVRMGLAIKMEHNHMMSAKGIADFQNQVQQLVGSIQKTNDLDVHIAMIQAESYQKEWNEKFQTTERTTSAMCRQYVDLFGFMQKNPNALDILIEEAKINIKLWGGTDPSFLMCNQKLTFQLTMNPERTSFVTHGTDGVKRLREGPNLVKYRGLQIIHTRKYALEENTEPRDILRRRVRVGEYYHIPPQTSSNWFVELYDESRDSWFKLSKEDLDKHSRIDGRGDDDTNNMIDIQGDPIYWENIANAQAGHPDYEYRLSANTPNRTKPDATEIIFPKFMGLNTPLNFAQTVGAIYALDANVYDGGHIRREDWHAIVQGLNNNNQVFCPRPNSYEYMQHMSEEVPSDSAEVPLWLFTNAALLESTLTFLWFQFDVPQAFMIDHVFPFMVNNGALQATINDYRSIRAGINGQNPNTFNIYHTVMFLLPAMRWHPVDSVRETIEELFTRKSIGVRNLASSLTKFVRDCFRRSSDPIPRNRIQLGKRLDAHFRTNRLPKAPAHSCIFDRWPSHCPQSIGRRDIMHEAGVSASNGYIEDYLIEKAYEDNNDYTWNNLPSRLTDNPSLSFSEDNVIDSFIYAMLHRNMFTDPIPQIRLAFTPISKQMESKDTYEYVIVRPCIEHAMLGVIMGHGGDDLGNTFWGQSELSCYDDSFHGVWGASYKYHSRALVTNSKNLVRVFDIAYDEYVGGKDATAVRWNKEKMGEERPFYQAVSNLTVPYTGPSFFVMRFKVNKRETRPAWPSPIIIHDTLDSDMPPVAVDPDGHHVISDKSWRIFNDPCYREQYRNYLPMIPDFTYIHSMRKEPGFASVDSEAAQNGLCFSGTYRICTVNNGIVQREEIMGNGHHGPDYVGVASLRNGKGIRNTYAAPGAMKIF